tara:strand:+ start:877 stop:1632 length:756 start_codon:yes stop_codon:yes gene_type:complete
MAQSGYGRIRYFNDFLGAEIPVATNVAYGTTAGGCNYYLGEFKVTGDIDNTDSGAVSLARSGGWIRLTGTDVNGEGLAVGTEAIFSPSLMGTLAIEARVSTQALTARCLFVGFCDANADAVVEPMRSTGTTHTMVASDLCGFIFDSQLTASTTWHAVYNGGSTTGATDSTATTTSVVAVANTAQVLRVEIDPNGTARYYIDGVIKSTVAGAASTTVLQAGLVGVWGTTTTVSDFDVDYIALEANRNWVTTD